MTFLFNYLQHEVLLLEAIDEFGYGALALVCAITTLGSFVLCTYFTAMYVIVYLERMGRFADVCPTLLCCSPVRIWTRSSTDRWDASSYLLIT